MPVLDAKHLITYEDEEITMPNEEQYHQITLVDFALKKESTSVSLYQPQCIVGREDGS